MTFVVNKNAQMSTGEHVIHTANCSRKPKKENWIELGDFANEKVAFYEAHKYYTCVNGCKYCCNKIHLKR